MSAAAVNRKTRKRTTTGKPAARLFSATNSIKAFSLEAGPEAESHTPGADSIERNTDLAWGAGLNFNIGKHMGLRFEWERFTIKNHDSDLVSANIVHYFR